MSDEENSVKREANTYYELKKKYNDSWRDIEKEDVGIYKIRLI